ncbi:MAG: SRPBCC family protein [Actinomycetota bacterium]|nr:SRPBCC family protein [Actinomycetota bacterium]
MRRAVGTSGPLPPDQVWERYAVLAAWPSWSPQISRVDATSSRLTPGMTGVVHGPLGVRVPFEVLSVDETRRRWSWRVRAAVVTLDLVHEVREGPDGGSDTTLEVTGPAPVVLAYAPLAQLALGRLVLP